MKINPFVERIDAIEARAMARWEAADKADDEVGRVNESLNMYQARTLRSRFSALLLEASGMEQREPKS